MPLRANISRLKHVELRGNALKCRRDSNWLAAFARTPTHKKKLYSWRHFSSPTILLDICFVRTMTQGRTATGSNLAGAQALTKLTIAAGQRRLKRPILH